MLGVVRELVNCTLLLLIMQHMKAHVGSVPTGCVVISLLVDSGGLGERGLDEAAAAILVDSGLCVFVVSLVFGGMARFCVCLFSVRRVIP